MFMYFVGGLSRGGGCMYAELTDVADITCDAAVRGDAAAAAAAEMRSLYRY